MDSQDYVRTNGRLRPTFAHGHADRITSAIWKLSRDQARGSQKEIVIWINQAYLVKVFISVQVQDVGEEPAIAAAQVA